MKTTTNRLVRHIAKDPRPPNLFHFLPRTPHLTATLESIQRAGISTYLHSRNSNSPCEKKKKKKIQIIESCSVWLITTRALSHFLGHQRSSKSTCIISKHPPSRGLLSILGHGQFLLSPTPPLLPQNRAQSSAKSLVPRPPTRPYTLTSCHSTTTTTTTHTHTHTHIILLGDAWA